MRISPTKLRLRSCCPLRQLSSTLVVFACATAISPAALAVRHYRVVDLTGLVAPGDVVTPADVNNAGQIVGTVTSSTSARGFFYDGTTTTLLAPIATTLYDRSAATGVNSLGQIVGLSDDAGIPKAAYWSSPTAMPVSLATGGGPDANVYANAINDSATIVGFFTGSGSGNTKSWTAVKWQPESSDPQRFRFTKLDTPVPPPAGAPAGAFGLNQNGDVVGNGAVDLVDPIRGPLRWAPDDQVTPLGMLPTVFTQEYDVVAVNNSRTAVGRMVLPSGAETAMKWNADGSIVSLGVPMGFEQSAAVDVNAAGLIIGRATSPSASIAAVYLDGAWIDLNQLAMDAPGWSLESVAALNDQGAIVGVGKFQGLSRAFLLQPLTPTQMGDYNGTGTVEAGDYTTWRNSLGKAVPSGTGADGDSDGRVTLADYDVWKSHYGMSLGSAGIIYATAAAAPEPSAASLTVCLLLVALSGRSSRRAFASPDTKLRRSVAAFSR